MDRRIKINSFLIAVICIFVVVSSADGANESRQLFKHKKVDHKKLSTQSEEWLHKKKSVFKGEDVEKTERRKRETQRVLQLNLEDISQIHIPSEIGRVVEVYEAPTRDRQRLIVHIQDLHTNPEGQYNEAKILDILVKDYKMGLVLSEGAEGEVDTSSVSSFPDPEIREKTARLFVDSGELTAEEYLSITKYPELPIWGIEDKEVYFKNIIQFNKIMRFSPRSQVFIGDVKKTLEGLKSGIYSKELLEVEQKDLDYEDEKIETDEYLKYLASYIQRFNIPTSKYKNISLLDETMKQEKTIDQEKITAQSKELLLSIESYLSGNNLKADKDSLMAKAQLFKEEKISPFSFYRYLNELGLKYIPDKLSNCPDLKEFIDYLTKVNSLDTVRLFSEMEELSYEVKQNLCQNQKQKTLTEALRNINFLDAFFRLKVSNEELARYLQDRESHKVVWFKSAIASLTNKAEPVDYNPDLIDDRFGDIEEFYETVKIRDAALIKNALSEIERRKAKVAALISGGFHTEAITSSLRERGYSYIVVSPFSSTEIDEKNYHYLLSGKRKPLSEIIDEFSEEGEAPEEESEE